MGITLRILFEGLIGFVPEITEGGRAVAMNALLTDARPVIESRVEDGRGGRLRHVPHIPTVRVRSADVVSASGIALNLANGFVEWALDRDFLDVVPNGEIREVSDALDVMHLGSAGSHPTTAAERADVRWIPNIRDFVSSDAEASVSEAVVRPRDPASLDPLVAAQMRFTTGRFFSEPSSISDVVYEFVPLPQSVSTVTRPPNPTPVFQAVAAFTALERVYAIPDASLVGGTLLLQSARTGGYLEIVPSVGSTIEVVLSNIPPSGSKPTADFTAYARMMVDFDYELMYQLSSTPPSAVSVPAAEADAVRGGGDFKPCSTGCFLPIRA
jgi:hypothetical protein